MKEKWCGGPCTLILVAGVMLVLVSIVHSEGWEGRKKQARDTCTAEYRSFNPKHTLCATPYPGARLTRLGRRARNHILNQHNDYRANVAPPAANMMKMIWDDRLAKSAQQLVLQCVHEHDNMSQRMEPDWPVVQIGQNLGVGHHSFRGMLHRFYTEKDRHHYHFGQGYIDHVGHFFQMVAYESSRVGCAEALCPTVDGTKVIRACNYAPAMNTAKPPYTPGTPCSACPRHCDSSGKLCDCGGKLCFNGGEVDPRTCRCKCRGAWTGRRCDKLDCSRPDAAYCSRYVQSQCGKESSVLYDSTLCPHLCGHCGEGCEYLDCKNDGVMNWSTCRCDCRGLFQGLTCEDCPRRDDPLCTTNHLPEECHTNTFVRLSCPNFCRTCKSQCKPCENHGILDTQTCQCECKGVFKGLSAQCDKCPEQEADVCHFIRFLLRSRNIATRIRWRHTCPYTAGICKKD